MLTGSHCVVRKSDGVAQAGSQVCELKSRSERRSSLEKLSAIAVNNLQPGLSQVGRVCLPECCGSANHARLGLALCALPTCITFKYTGLSSLTSSLTKTYISGMQTSKAALIMNVG